MERILGELWRPKAMDRKGYPPFEDLGTDDDTVEDAGVT
jgi:hypothetical protein